MLTGTEHFSLDEVAANTEFPIPVAYQDDAQATLETLELVRSILGVPLRLTSLWRSPANNNAQPGHAAASQHLSARAADFEPEGLTLQDAAARWAAAVQRGDVPEFHQFLIEENGEDGLRAHAHFGTGTGAQSLVRTANGSYQLLTDWLAARGAAIAAAVTDAASSAGAAIAGAATDVEAAPAAVGFQSAPVLC